MQPVGRAAGRNSEPVDCGPTPKLRTRCPLPDEPWTLQILAEAWQTDDRPREELHPIPGGPEHAIWPPNHLARAPVHGCGERPGRAPRSYRVRAHRADEPAD